MRKIITYAIDKYTGLVFSQVGHEMAVPVLDFDYMKPGNNFETRYTLQTVPVLAAHIGTLFKFTRKIPNAVKNIHREYWGMKPLKGKNRWEKE